MFKDPRQPRAKGRTCPPSTPKKKTQKRKRKGQASADLHLAPAADLALNPGSRTGRPTLDVIQTEKLSSPQESGSMVGACGFACPLGIHEFSGIIDGIGLACLAHLETKFGWAARVGCREHETGGKGRRPRPGPLRQPASLGTCCRQLAVWYMVG
jgi:hypothetical protein